MVQVVAPAKLKKKTSVVKLLKLHVDCSLRNVPEFSSWAIRACSCLRRAKLSSGTFSAYRGACSRLINRTLVYMTSLTEVTYRVPASGTGEAIVVAKGTVLPSHTVNRRCSRCSALLAGGTLGTSTLARGVLVRSSSTRSRRLHCS